MDISLSILFAECPVNVVHHRSVYTPAARSALSYSAWDSCMTTVAFEFEPTDDVTDAMILNTCANPAHVQCWTTRVWPRDINAWAVGIFNAELEHRHSSTAQFVPWMILLGWDAATVDLETLGTHFYHQTTWNLALVVASYVRAIQSKMRSSNFERWKISHWMHRKNQKSWLCKAYTWNGGHSCGNTVVSCIHNLTWHQQQQCHQAHARTQSTMAHQGCRYVIHKGKSCTWQISRMKTHRRQIF